MKTRKQLIEDQRANDADEKARAELRILHTKMRPDQWLRNRDANLLLRRRRVEARAVWALVVLVLIAIVYTLDRMP